MIVVVVTEMIEAVAVVLVEIMGMLLEMMVVKVMTS